MKNSFLIYIILIHNLLITKSLPCRATEPLERISARERSVLLALEQDAALVD